MSLRVVFEDFKRDKETLQERHVETLKCFSMIEKHCSQAEHRELVEGSQMEGVMHQGASNAQSELAATRTLTEYLYTQREQKEVTRLFSQQPSLVVVGQTNCGKSSIINGLLGYRVLPTSDQPCTARAVHMTYSENPFLQLVVKDEIQPQKILRPNRIPRQLIQLNLQGRNDKDRAIEFVKAGLSLDFLKSGVDVVDTPGLNENLVLNELVREQLDSILPFIIYVIDGHNLFGSLICVTCYEENTFTELFSRILPQVTRNTKVEIGMPVVIEHGGEITRATRDGKNHEYYTSYSTKKDRMFLDKMFKEREGLDIFYVVNKIEPIDENEVLSSNEEPIQESKKRRVYDKLVKHGFLVPEGKTMHSHENFHGLSCWKINEFNRKKKMDAQWDDPEGVYTEYNEAFKRFQTCLQRFSESSLKACVERSCQILIAVLSRCLNFFIQTANVARLSKEATLAMIGEIQHVEKTLYINFKKTIEERRNQCIQAITDVISELEEVVVKQAQDFKYSDFEFQNPPKGLVCRAEPSQCRSQIRHMVRNKVQWRMNETLVNMFAKIMKTLEKEVKKVEVGAFPDGCESAAAVVLRTTLASCYKVTTSPQPNNVLKFYNRFIEFLKSLVNRPMDAISGTANVDDPDWKQRQALDTLKAMSVESLASHLMKAVQSSVCESHKMFKEEVRKFLDVSNRRASLDDKQRKAILKFSPDIASLEMCCHSFKDRLKYGQPQEGKVIGTGAQSTVYTCDNITTPDGKPCVVKVVPLFDEKELNDLVLELHNTRTLNHPNILPLVCTIIKQGTVYPKRKFPITVYLVSERIKSDLHVALPNLSSLRARLEILLDVAQALQYLHKQGLMHRDVKMRNVLVDDENRGRLTDMGFCKSEILTEGSIVGTPAFMAPEIISQRTRYSNAVDVYAFGILMWCVCEGQGNLPKNIFLHRVLKTMLEKNAKENRRPEKLDKFSELCWQLMVRCWATESESRPSFDFIVNELNEIVKDVVE